MAASSSVGAPKTAHELIRAVRTIWLERMILKPRVRPSETRGLRRDVLSNDGNVRSCGQEDSASASLLSA
jgi:hypothetical protein